jgi:hypothetical protein
MRIRKHTGAAALVAATTAVGLLATTGSAAAGQGDTFCTWGGTPTAPTGIITLSPGLTNTPSTGPIQFTATGPLGGSGCSGKLTFNGSFEPGGTCAVGAPFHAKATGLPPVTRAESQTPSLAGTGLTLLYDAQGNVVGAEEPQFLTTLANESDPGYLNCSTPQGLTEAFWSDTIELFASK